MNVEIKRIKDKTGGYDHEKIVIVVTEATVSEKTMMKSFGNSYSVPEELNETLFSELPICLEEDLELIEEVHLKKRGE